MVDGVRSFKLSDSFIDEYKNKVPDFGPLGLITYARTYSRVKEDGTQEEFWETCKRVVEGAYDVQKKHCAHLGLQWDNTKAQRSAQEMYRRMFDMKFLPPGRGMWMMGTEHVDRVGSVCLNNCCFISTDNIKVDFADPFCTTMDYLMLGVGVGFDTRGAGTMKVSKPRITADTHVVHDSREGWVDLLRRVLTAYSGKGSLPETIDYSQVRSEGTPIKGFGGTASGPGPLKEMIDDIREILENLTDQHITVECIVDIANLIGRCVVAGNVRRSAEIAFGDITDETFLNLKNPDINKDALYHHRWASNNSVFSSVGSDYADVAKLTVMNGEPGYFWLENARKFSRMGEEDWKDSRVLGTNPCQPAWAPVLTRDGIRPMGEIREGDEIWSNGKWVTVAKKWSTGVKDVYEYKTTAGTFYGTENHRVVQTGEKIEVSEAESIDVCRGPEHSDLVVDPQAVVDGLFVGDGYTHTKGRYKLLCIGENDQDYFKSEIADYIGKLFDKDYAYLIDTSLVGVVEPWNREVPMIYYEAKPQYAASFLRGLFSANGSVIKTGKSGRVTLKTTSPKLREQVQTMLSSLGIRSYFTTNKPQNIKWENGEYVSRESYDINISTDRGVFAKHIGFLQEYKNQKLAETLGEPSKYAHSRPKATYDIIERNKISTEEVFDITVNDEDHVYWTGGLLVSNCGEIPLESYELCVSGDTRILTRDGYPEISEVVGKEVDIWNGENWSTVKPFKTGSNQKLYRVTLSDGSFLDVTAKHGWSIHKYRDKYERVETQDLEPGMKLERLELAPTEVGVREPNAYRIGWFTGDGFVDQEQPIVLVQEPEYSVLPELNGVEYPEQHPKNYARPFKRVSLRNYIDIDMAMDLRNKEMGLPEEMFSWDARSISEFIGGWIDTDGSVIRQSSTDNFVLYSSSEKKIRDAHILLRKIGVNYASVQLYREEGSATNYSDNCSALWKLFIPSFEADKISTFLKKPLRFGSRFRNNNAHAGSTIDAARRQKIVSVEELSGTHDTFCFTEPTRHMGVFGNVLTYQCNLVETFPSRHDSYEDFEKTLKYAYLYAKTVTLIPTHNEKTNVVVARNRRIGTSMSGITQAIQKFGRREFMNWCDNGYSYIRELDDQYSRWLGVRESIKVTTVKPSGTISLLPGVTPGIHYPHSKYYIRRIRLQESHYLVKLLQDHGYNIEKDQYSPNTVVAEFPVMEEYFDRSKDEVTMWEQLELAAQLQQYWADNMVSVTVTFTPQEGAQMDKALELYETRLKSVSFLPLDGGGYAQAPYEAITEEQFKEMASKIKPITSTKIEHDQTEKYCSNDGVCMI